jgi:iron complex outermembrane receptor protein
MSSLLRAIACCVVGSFLARAAKADAPPEAPSGRALTAEIPAGSLADALADFARQTGVELVYVSELANGRTSRKVSTGLPPAAALSRLLAGSGLDFVFLNSQTVKIFKNSARPAERNRTKVPTISTDEVVVTATKRVAALAAVPISATVLTADTIQALDVKTIGDVSAIAPGIEYDFNTQFGPGVLNNIAIRGIQSSVGTSTTAIYVDDLPIQARASGFANAYAATFDLARIEVLRGPQGTLFGASAEGGAVRFISNEASTTTSSGLYRMELDVTENGGPSLEAGAAVGVPIIEGKLGVRVSAWYREEGGYVDRVDPFTYAVTDRNANRSTNRAVRAAFAVTPTDSLRITPSLAYQSRDLHDTPVFYPYLSNPDAGIFKNGKLLRQPAVDEFAVAAIKIEQELTAANLTTVVSYFDRRATSTVDSTNIAGVVFFNGFGNPLGPAYPTSYLDAVPDAIALHQTELSQEIRLSSKDPDARLRWIVGLFYSRSRQDYSEDIYGISAPENPGLYDYRDTIDTSIAGFAHLDLTIAPRWTVNIGMRLDRIENEFTEHTAGFAYPDLPSSVRGTTQDTPVTPQFGVSYQAAEHTLLYATVAKGFRGGGINTAIPDRCGVSPVPSYASDSLWSHEVGAKARLLDGRLQLAASAFEIDWTGIQYDVYFNCGFGYTGNAGAATSRGFDLTANARITERLGMDLALGSLDAHYTRTILSPSGAVIVDRGTVVGEVPQVPAPWSGWVDMHYQWAMAHNVLGYVRIDDSVWSHNPGPFSELDPRVIGYEPRFLADPATNLLGLQLGFVRSRLDVKLSLQNALNSHPVLQPSADAPGSALIYAHTLRPRTWALTAVSGF